jgi:hypothetical protein
MAPSKLKGHLHTKHSHLCEKPTEQLTVCLENFSASFSVPWVETGWKSLLYNHRTCEPSSGVSIGVPTNSLQLARSGRYISCSCIQRETDRKLIIMKH